MKGKPVACQSCGKDITHAPQYVETDGAKVTRRLCPACGLKLLRRQKIRFCRAISTLCAHA